MTNSESSLVGLGDDVGKFLHLTLCVRGFDLGFTDSPHLPALVFGAIGWP